MSVGKKGPNGAPTERDRFYVVEVESRQRAAGSRKIDYRPPDPRFEPYHRLDVADRRKFYGMIGHHTEPEFFEPSYLAHRGPRRPDVVNPSHRGPWCHGNGETAERWDGSSYGQIVCPGEGCPFRQETPDARGNLSSPCKPQARFYFIPRWPDFLGPWAQGMERPMMKLVSKGRLARETFAGMLQSVRETAEPLGIPINSWFGLPFAVSLGERTGARDRRRYPVLSFALDGDPVQWLRWQAGEFQGLLDTPTTLALGAASDAEREAEAVGADHESVVPTKPVAYVAPKDDEPHAEPTESPDDVVDVVEVETGEASTSEPPNVVKLEVWIEETKAKKGRVTRALGLAGLISKGQRWSDIGDDVSWSDIEAAISGVES